jgi:hypothetical protein
VSFYGIQSQIHFLCVPLNIHRTDQCFKQNFMFLESTFYVMYQLFLCREYPLRILNALDFGLITSCNGLTRHKIKSFIKCLVKTNKVEINEIRLVVSQITSTDGQTNYPLFCIYFNECGEKRKLIIFFRHCE